MMLRDYKMYAEEEKKKQKMSGNEEKKEEKGKEKRNKPNKKVRFDNKAFVVLIPCVRLAEVQKIA